jgi:hypothetical protein
MRDGVLDDEGRNPLRMGQRHPKAHGAPIILHIKRGARDPERLGK